MSDNTSVWSPLIEQWVQREQRLHPDAPIADGSIAIRDAVEVGDAAYVLVSYDIDWPWPQEEDASGADRFDTAVLQAIRVSTPWIERDATRALSHARSSDGRVRLQDHLLGDRRAISGAVDDDSTSITLTFADDDTEQISVVDGWFLAIVDAGKRVVQLSGTNAGGESWDSDIERDDVSELIGDLDFARHAGRSMYFSPLDLRRVEPIIQWERTGAVAVVAVALEQYDDGGVLRLRIDGIRPDDDVLHRWPQVHLTSAGQALASAITGESTYADTLTMDIGFSPWIGDDVTELGLRVSGLRGETGEIDDVEMTVRLDAARRR